MDDNDHGTHVAGTIGAVGNNNVGVVGVNWNVRLMSCKFFDASGQGTTEGAIACLEYVKTMKDLGVNIVATSNSWGGGDFSQALIDAIDDQRQSDILFITAAGNGNFRDWTERYKSIYPCDTYLPNVICVAATDRTDARASFSNFGRHTVHISAPGRHIKHTSGDNYATESGTSIATPHARRCCSSQARSDSGLEGDQEPHLNGRGHDQFHGEYHHGETVECERRHELFEHRGSVAAHAHHQHDQRIAGRSRGFGIPQHKVRCTEWLR
jgi:hypothetical protein